MRVSCWRLGRNGQGVTASLLLNKLLFFYQDYHSFNLMSASQEKHLTFYDQLKIINYVRRQVSHSYYNPFWSSPHMHFILIPLTLSPSPSPPHPLSLILSPTSFPPHPLTLSPSPSSPYPLPLILSPSPSLHLTLPPHPSSSPSPPHPHSHYFPSPLPVCLSKPDCCRCLNVSVWAVLEHSHLVRNWSLTWSVLGTLMSSSVTLRHGTSQSEPYSLVSTSKNLTTPY